jgi:hypothetical protein
MWSKDVRALLKHRFPLFIQIKTRENKRKKKKKIKEKKKGGTIDPLCGMTSPTPLPQRRVGQALTLPMIPEEVT